MVWTGDLVAGRFDSAQEYAEDALENAESYAATLTSLLAELELPLYDAVSAVEPPELPPIDYSARPSFTAALEAFPTFDNESPADPDLAAIPDIDVDTTIDNIEFTENSYLAPTISIGNAPENDVSLDSITIPTKPSLVMPAVPTLDDITLPAAPTIDIAEFSAAPPGAFTAGEPGAFSYTPDAYNSDIRVPLFAKILYDLQNGGTGLDATVEADIYARGIERQKVENESLYKETEDRFTATGFSLPTGALASALQAVSEEISRKNDQMSREIVINQAELAQKNTQFTTDQARQIEGLLMDFYNSQENRSLEASKAIAQSAIEIFNSLITNHKLKLEQYQAEASVFEIKIKAELAAVEIYKAEIEGAKAATDVQLARVSIYNAQLSGLETLMKLYSVEMESVKIHSEVQMAKIEIFKAETEAYVAGIGAEKVKAEIFGVQVDSEKARAIVYGERVKASALKVDAAKADASIQQMNADNILKTNQLKVTEFSALLDKYRAEIEFEIKNAQLTVDVFKAEAAAFEVETNAVGMEYGARTSEGQLRVEEFKAVIAEQIAIIESAKDGYIALKGLQVKGTEGMMNVNAQLAASAMNAVNASASHSLSSSYSESESESLTETHYYKEK